MTDTISTPIIEGELVVLRTVVPADRETYLAGARQAETVWGFGTEAMKLVLNHGLSEMKLHRIDLRVLARNKRAIRAFEKCGFVHEGTERETVYLDDNW